MNRSWCCFSLVFVFMRVLSFEKGNQQSGQVLYVSVVQEEVTNKVIIIAAFSEVVSKPDPL